MGGEAFVGVVEADDDECALCCKLAHVGSDASAEARNLISALSKNN